MRALILACLLIAPQLQAADLYCTGSFTASATMKIIIADGRVTIIPIKAPEEKK